MIIFILKWKNLPDCVELTLFSLFIQIYIAKVPIGSGSGENFSDPTPDADPAK